MKRDELQRRIRTVVTGCEGCTPEDPCIYCMVAGAALQQAVRDIMELIDQHVDDILIGLHSDEELWTARQVAEYLGLTSGADGARYTLSRWKIRAVRHVANPRTGRPMALYSAKEVRNKHEARKAATR